MAVTEGPGLPGVTERILTRTGTGYIIGCMSKCLQLRICLALVITAAIHLILSNDSLRMVARVHADDGETAIEDVSPAPPSCVLRQSTNESARTLTISGTNLSSDGGRRVVFLNVRTGEHTLHFRQQLNWSDTTLFQTRTITECSTALRWRGTIGC